VVGVKLVDAVYGEVVSLPRLVPPLVQVVGALACGPKTVNVTAPVAPELPVSVAVIELVAIVVPIVPEAGAPAVIVGDVLPTTVSLMPEPHVVTLALLLASPP
jgi:hypothetical protein